MLLGGTGQFPPDTSNEVMIRQLKTLFLVCLPALVYVPLLIGGRLLVGGSIPPWVDWTFLLGSAALVALNPIPWKCESGWLRMLALAVGFGLWVMVLFFLTFRIMSIVFEEGL